MDEYQLQVPLKYKRVYEFNTIQELEEFKNNHPNNVFDGHKYKKARKDEMGNEVKDVNGDTVFDPITNENGKLQLVYCPVGEMVVRCIEKAARIMKLPVHITGEYLTGRSWSDCH